jgi:hypothetical protein
LPSCQSETGAGYRGPNDAFSGQDATVDVGGTPVRSGGLARLGVVPHRVSLRAVRRGAPAAGSRHLVFLFGCLGPGRGDRRDRSDPAETMGPHGGCDRFGCHDARRGGRGRRDSSAGRARLEPSIFLGRVSPKVPCVFIVPGGRAPLALKPASRVPAPRTHASTRCARPSATLSLAPAAGAANTLRTLGAGHYRGATFSRRGPPCRHACSPRPRAWR